MTNYNDGKWHGWNGGECPVHPQTEVHLVYDDGYVLYNEEAGAPNMVRWTHDLKGRKVIAFRVTKEYKEPREFWICLDYGGNILDFKKEKPDDVYGYIHVKEVT